MPCRRDVGYVFTVGSTGDSPVPSGDSPDGTEGGIERNNAVLSHPSVTTMPPGGSPGGAGGSPAPPSVNRYDVGSPLLALSSQKFEGQPPTRLKISYSHSTNRG